MNNLISYSNILNSILGALLTEHPLTMNVTFRKVPFTEHIEHVTTEHIVLNIILISQNESYTSTYPIVIVMYIVAENGTFSLQTTTYLP